PTGRQSFRGLPFVVGDDEGRCFLALGGSLDREAVTLPIGRAARSVIVAHRLLESKIMDGGPVGEEVAHYVVRFADGDEERVTIRDRFEIAIVPTGWGQLPFNALPDQGNGLPARYEGRFESAGTRQTEASQG